MSATASSAESMNWADTCLVVESDLRHVVLTRDTCLICPNMVDITGDMTPCVSGDHLDNLDMLFVERETSDCGV